MADLDGDAAVFRSGPSGVDDLVVAPDVADAAEGLAQVLDAARAAQDAGARLWLLTQGAWGPFAGGGCGLGPGAALWPSRRRSSTVRMIDVAPDMGCDGRGRGLLLAEAA